ncbi:hypothetical protein EOD23_00960 [Mesorhizobium sp. USDA-HM6]|nr:hypothetical protein EOD23_00960 [Mesorhizobium sp. USDA-HM6]
MSALDGLRAAISKRDRITAEIAAARTTTADLAEAELAVSDAALAAFRADRDEARAAAFEIIASLVPVMARLVAADHVRRALVGERYRFDATRHPPVELWSGEIVARSLANAVPDRFRPEAFTETIEAAASGMAANALASLKGNPK